MQQYIRYENEVLEIILAPRLALTLKLKRKKKTQVFVVSGNFHQPENQEPNLLVLSSPQQISRATASLLMPHQLALYYPRY